jgi:polysaccharide biosynthesis transport protein
MELRDFLKVIRARMPLIVLSVVVVTVAVVAAGLLQKPAYQGVALVLVTRQNTGATVLGTPQTQDSYQPGRDEVQTQVEVIQSPRIAQQVVANLHLQVSAASLLKRLTVTADTGTNNITIQAVDPSPEGAAQIANAFAQAYVDWSRESQTESLKAAADGVDWRLGLAQQEIVAIEGTKSTTGATQEKLAAARALYAMLADKLEQLRIAQQLVTGSGSVLASATVDPVPVSPRPARDGALGLAVGLFLGLMIALLAEQLDVRFKSADEAAAVYGAPVLASIPIEKISGAELDRLTVTARPGSPAAEAYRMLRNSLGFVNFDKGIKTVLVTSAVPNEGKSTVAANLATVLSRAGSKVVLVVCDFYLPSAERFFGIENSVGLSDVLAGSSSVSAALQRPDGFDNLAVLPSGPLPPNPSELLGSDAMRTLVAGLRQSADWVILDSAPLLAAADAAAVTRWVDGVMIVTRVGTSRRDSARTGHEQLLSVGARILGLAVWGPVDTAATRGYYGYHESAAR